MRVVSTCIQFVCQRPALSRLSAMCLALVLASAPEAVAQSGPWTRQINTLAASTDQAGMVSVDASGNATSVISSNDGSAQRHVVVVRYNSSGVEQWSYHFDPDINNSTQAEAMIVDGSGSVYVLATTPEMFGPTTCRFFKVNASGAQEWSTTLSFVDGGSLEGAGLAIGPDSAPVMYLNENQDIRIVKMTTSGDTSWTCIYTSPNEGYDHARGLVVDGTGAITIAGDANDVDGYADLVVARFSSTGQLLWDVVASGGPNTDQRGRAIVGDGAAVYVATDWVSLVDENEVHNIVVHKVDTSGSIVWADSIDVSDYDEPAAIVRDSTGNVVVIGTVETPADQFYIRAFDTSGAVQWTTTVDDPFAQGVTAEYAGVDGAGTIYATSTVYDGSRSVGMVVAVDATGDTLWTRLLSRNGTSSDVLSAFAPSPVSGIVGATTSRAASSSRYDAGTLRLSSAGAVSWATYFDGQSNRNERVRGAAFGADGSTIFVSDNAEFANGNEIAVLKVNADGDTLWSASFDDGSELTAKGVGVDATGNVYVGAKRSANFGGTEFLMIKFSSAGVQQWASTAAPSVNGAQMNAMAVGSDGSTWATGQSDSTYPNDVYTVRWNAAGDVAWARSYDGTGNNIDYGRALVPDDSGHIYVAAPSYGATTQYDYVVLKYDSLGGLVWEARVDASGGYDFPAAIALDDSGNVLVTGSMNGLPDYGTVKISNAGAHQWTSLYAGPGTYDQALAIAADADGNVYVTGSSAGLSSDDVATVKYNRDGVQQWASRYNGTGDGDDVGKGVTVDALGDVYVTGNAADNSLSPYLMVIKYYDDGSQAWVSTDQPGSDNDGLAIMVAPDDDILVAGVTIGAMTGSDFFALKVSASDGQLPVQMAGMHAEVISGGSAPRRGSGQEVRLSWTTASEVDNLGWEVQRRAIGDWRPSTPLGTRVSSVDYQTIGFVEGAGTSSAAREYTFTDHALFDNRQSQIDNPTRFVYRLKQLDRSGSFSYSHEVEVEIGAAPREFKLGQNYPNPFNPATTIDFTLAQDGPASLRIYDLLGREVAMLVNGDLKAGVQHRVEFDASSLSSGVYVVRLTSGSQSQLRRLVLMK